MTNGIMPADIPDTDNLRFFWNDKSICELEAGVVLTPLEAKALHVMGLMLQNFEAAGHLLHFEDQKMAANYYLQAFFLACTAIELLSYCKNGRENLLKDQNDGLKSGFQIVGLETIETNNKIYEVEDLIALRNLAAHGQGVASAEGAVKAVFLDVELLDKFPDKLMKAFDDYYKLLFESKQKRWRRNLAKAGIHPVHYVNPENSGRAFHLPIRYAYRNLIAVKRLPSQALITIDWQVYKKE